MIFVLMALALPMDVCRAAAFRRKRAGELGFHAA